jgi:hypothetical protein
MNLAQFVGHCIIYIRTEVRTPIIALIHFKGEISSPKKWYDYEIKRVEITKWYDYIPKKINIPQQSTSTNYMCPVSLAF